MKINDLIKKYDSQNQFEVLQNTYKQITFAWENKFDLSSLKKKKFSSIVFCGLGGSAISGDLLNDYLSGELNYPFIIVRGYNLPSFINAETLVIISSYSGNTEETISCFQQALTKKCKIIVITSGGNIGEIAQKNSIPIINLKSGYQPRYALGQGFFSLLKLMQELGFAKEEKNVETITYLWKKRAKEYSTDYNKAIQIASELVGFVPVIYSAEFLSSSAYRFKSQLNENSKLHAFVNSIPEMNHNEIIGWESFKEKQFFAKVIFLIDKEFNPRNLKRFKILHEILNEKKIDMLTISSDVENKKVRIMDLTFLFDWITFYVSIIRGFDPSEIDFIHRMKQHLS